MYSLYEVRCNDRYLTIDALGRDLVLSDSKSIRTNITITTLCAYPNINLAHATEQL